MTGGSAATFYAPQRYVSDDIDFVVTFSGSGATEVLRSLDFVLRGDLYVHKRSRYTIDFVRGPLAVGDDLIARWDTVKRKRLKLHIIRRTDSVRDRLAAYYHWNDVQSLHTARDVALSGPVDWQIVRRWSRNEGQLAKLEELMHLLKPGG